MEDRNSRDGDAGAPLRNRLLAIGARLRGLSPNVDLRRLIGLGANATLTAIMVVILISAVQLGWAAFRYDDSPPLVLHSIKLDTHDVLAGSTITYNASYDKRAECHPPDGHGTVSYRFKALDGDPNKGVMIYDNVRKSRTTHWPAGKGLEGAGWIEVPSDLPAGGYVVTRTSRYVCSNSSRELVVTSPAITIRVRPAKGRNDPA
jgi:hypothetical protein